MRPNLPFLLAASNAILKPGGPLKWKKQLVKDVKPSLWLTEVMKFVTLTSPLSDVLRLSSPRPRLRLRHRRRLALPSHLNLTVNLYTLSFTLLLVLLPHLPPLLIYPSVPLSGNRFLSSPITCNPTFLSPMGPRTFVSPGKRRG